MFIVPLQTCDEAVHVYLVCDAAVQPKSVPAPLSTTVHRKQTALETGDRPSKHLIKSINDKHASQMVSWPPKGPVAKLEGAMKSFQNVQESEVCPPPPAEGYRKLSWQP